MSTASARARLARAYPWLKPPFIISAPMKPIAGPSLAFAVSKAGGLGFIGPGMKHEDTAKNLAAVRKLVTETPIGQSTDVLPVGIGFIVWDADIESASAAIKEHRPCAAWLFAPSRGQEELDEWAVRLREASPGIEIWIQVGTLHEAIDASKSPHRPDVLVVQGTEAGGHGRAKDGVGLTTLLPEIADALRSSNIPLIAAGGIADGRGVLAAHSLGASGTVMGTRFLASHEASLKKGYQDEVIRASDGGKNTTRTLLYNHLRGMYGWPEEYAPRGVVNQSFYDEQNGVPFEELKRMHDEALSEGDGNGAWGEGGRAATYAGTGVGLVREVLAAGEIVERVREETKEVLQGLTGL